MTYKKGKDSKSRVNRSVSFNIDDPFEKAMLNYGDTLPNFSGFMKSLLLMYLNSNQLTPNKPVPKSETSQSFSNGLITKIQ